MISRRNVISICIVIIVILILVIILISSKSYANKAYDNNSGIDSQFDESEYNGENGNNKTSLITEGYYKEAGQDEVNQPLTGENEQKYIVRDINDGIVIYKCIVVNNEEKEEFFDYAFINPASCSKEVSDALKKGIEFYGEKELYDFLQAYSS